MISALYTHTERSNSGRLQEHGNCIEQLPFSTLTAHTRASAAEAGTGAPLQTTRRGFHPCAEKACG